MYVVVREFILLVVALGKEKKVLKHWMSLSTYSAVIEIVVTFLTAWNSG